MDLATGYSRQPESSILSTMSLDKREGYYGLVFELGAEMAGQGSERRRDWRKSE
jgi:hypothetical protein